MPAPYLEGQRFHAHLRGCQAHLCSVQPCTQVLPMALRQAAACRAASQLPAASRAHSQWVAAFPHAACRYRLLRLDHSVLGGEYIAPPDVAGQTSEPPRHQLRTQLHMPLVLSLYTRTN